MLLKTFYYAARNICNYWMAKQLDKIVGGKLREDNKKTISIAVHGSWQNHSSSFYDMVRWFDKRGILIIPVKYDYNLDLNKAAIEVKRQIKAIIKKTHAKKINIIAHSYGGLVARYYVQKLHGSKITKNLITIGTSHYGIDISNPWLKLLSIMPGLIKDEEIMGNPIIINLNKTDKFRNHVVIIGLDDKLVPPNANYYAKAKKIIYLKGIGHLGELHNEKCFEAIFKELNCKN